MSDLTCVEKKYRVGFARVDGQSAGLPSLAQHLHHSRQIVMRKIAAQAGVRLTQ